MAATTNGAHGDFNGIRDRGEPIPVGVAVAATEGERTFKSRLRDILTPVYKPTRSRVFPGLARSIAMQPFVFEFWYRARAWRYLLTHGMQSFEGTTDADRSKSFLDKVASYNQSQIWTWHRVRTEKLMAVLRCIDDLPKDARMLIVGPRNEAELLLLHLYGFRLEHQRAIDIFSYSPKIELMDMHDIKFADNTFDVVYSAWTLRYSYDLKKACSELVRVAKPGGMVVTGFSHSKLNTDVTGALIEGGLSELHQMFEPHVDWVYWQESLKTTETNEEVTTIFRLRK